MISKKEFKRLTEQIVSSRKMMESYRNEEIKTIAQYVGADYSVGTHKKRVPLNLIELAIGIYKRKLFSANPQVDISTDFMDLAPQAESLKLGLNHYIKEEINLQEELSDIVTNSLFSFGIAKVAIQMSETTDFAGESFAVGAPGVETIDLEDLILDVDASNLNQCQYIGNKYVVALEDALKNPLFEEEARAKLIRKEVRTKDEEGQNTKAILSKSSTDQSELYYDVVELIDIYLPREDRIITFSLSSGETPIKLRDIEWYGLKSKSKISLGPYIILAFNRVPKNVLPLPPLLIVRDLHYLTNQLFNKLAGQATRQKTILAVQGDGDDGNRIVGANDGEAIRVDNPENIKEVRFGGADQQGLGMMLQTKQMFSEMAGNLNVLGGIGPGSETARQDQLMDRQSNERIESMQQHVVDFTSEILRHLAFYLWHDPFMELPLSYKVKGFDISIPKTWTPEDRTGNFMEFNLTIVPYSLREDTPTSKLEKLEMYIARFITPLFPFIQEQGGTIDVNTILEKAAEYLNMPWLNELVQFMDDDLIEKKPIGTPPSNPNNPNADSSGNTGGYYQVGGRSMSGNENALKQALLAPGTQNQDELAIAGNR